MDTYSMLPLLIHARKGSFLSMLLPTDIEVHPLCFVTIYEIRDCFIVTSRPQAGLHRFRSVHVGRLADVMKAVQDAAERGEIAVRGEPLAHVGRRAIYPDAEKGPPGLEVVPRRWVAFDWDGLPIRPRERHARTAGDRRRSRRGLELGATGPVARPGARRP